MIRSFRFSSGRLEAYPGGDVTGVVWIDLFEPTVEEERALEDKLKLELPTREEMREIEVSSRLYDENGASFMTATVPAMPDDGPPQLEPVTFVLTAERLITIRYHDPRAFRTFPARAEKVPMGCGTSEGVLLGLLEAVVDRMADILERAAREIDSASRTVFQHSAKKPSKSRDFQEVLRIVGREGDLVSGIRDSLASMERVSLFLSNGMIQRRSDDDARERAKTLTRDLRSLSDHAGFLSQKVTFLLEATLGLINIEQNAIIKIFSVAAVAFLPPTLIASIYGMNFAHMPELDWVTGYPLSLGLMIVSGLVPYVLFKRKGWL